MCESWLHEICHQNPVFKGLSLTVFSLPIDSLPVDSLPVDSLPVDSLPVDSLPVDSRSSGLFRISRKCWRNVSSL